MCPNREKSLGVSLTISPVTQMLEVDVKRLSIVFKGSPEEDTGRERINQPITIIQI